MDATHVDRIAKRFAAKRLSRRAAVRQGGAGLAAGALAAAGLAAHARTPAAAQEATPAAGAAGEKIQYLFVQSFQSGSIAPKAGEAGTYTLTLAQGLGQTIYFSDRPERIVGAAPTPTFLAGLGFPDDNPPNAALVAAAEPETEDIAVLELYNPRYDEATHTATYDVTALAAWEASLALGFAEAPSDLGQFAPSFGAAHLFIDDCPDWSGCWAECNIIPRRRGSYFGPVGACWSWSGANCSPANCGDTTDYDAICLQQLRQDHENGCDVYAGV